MFGNAGNLAGLVARSEKDVAAFRPLDGGADIVRDHQAGKAFTLRGGMRDLRRGDENRRAERVVSGVNGEAAPGVQSGAKRASRAIVFPAFQLPEDD